MSRKKYKCPVPGCDCDAEIMDIGVDRDRIARDELHLLVEIARERRRQVKKWGKQNHNPFVWMVILGEEVGEADKATIDGMTLHDLTKELVQVAAVAISAILALRRNQWDVKQDALTCENHWELPCKE